MCDFGCHLLSRCLVLLREFTDTARSVTGCSDALVLNEFVSRELHDSDTEVHIQHTTCMSLASNEFDMVVFHTHTIVFMQWECFIRKQNNHILIDLGVVV